jgi:histone acetyltransferase (RNA polymerase elongator complex component)
MTMPMIIPIFIMHRGCPHRCIFCNQQKAAGPYPEDISEAFFHRTVLSHLQHIRKEPDQVQIAFYGGNFTGMPKNEQIRMLEYAKPFLDTGRVSAVRISTRPDDIDRERLDLLKGYGVQIVEIGAQSFADDVLQRAGRGHTAGEVDAAVHLLKDQGFQVAVHLMAGLPGDHAETFAYSVDRVVALKPQMVRIHPTLVFTGTELEQDYRNGRYEPLTLDEAVNLCKSALLRFAAAGISVIRVGLQTTPEMQKHGTVIAGPCHPAFRFLVESSIFHDRAVSLLSGGDFEGKTVIFSVCPKEQSAFRGLKNENMRTLQNRFGLADIHVFPDPAQPAGALRAHCEG